MAKIKAVVMSHRNKYKNVLVYTEDGQYLTTRLTPMPPVGSTIYVQPPTAMAKPKFLVVAAAVLLILFTGLIPSFSPSPAAAAYINIAWQPEIGLWVDEEGQVIRASLVGLPNNSLSTTLKGQDLYTALGKVLQYSQEQGDLNKGRDILIGTYVKMGEQDIPEVSEARLKDFLSSQLKARGYQGSVVVTDQPVEAIQSADKIGVSLGKYVVYEKCQQQNQPVKLDLLRQENVSTALSQSGIEAKELFGQDYVEIPHMNSSDHMDNQVDKTKEQAMPQQPMHHQKPQSLAQPSPDSSDHNQMHPVQEHNAPSSSGNTRMPNHYRDDAMGMNMQKMGSD
ncbi:hypothetical protein [Desulforamulus aeronauticus]|uniref:Anti-sigma factor RsgI-like middle domain-containing protein n=1 Tax=Desulforamulus aeronauticus DSM 10349 TaxID=1121421 RepID=A0A1M6X5F9_9FIRM|nr:hypothetical protein [Desulforamulus aeronauticus]SHL01156.1 hypothetical protein SAMN02745123_03908 [Desulforamulus aeronauticus DSM 10349]